MKSSSIGRLCFVLVILLLTLGLPWKLYSQATTGYTKVNASAVAATTFTTSALPSGAYNYEVTALNVAGIESLPSNIVTPVVPNDGKTHTITLSWNAGANDVSYNVYTEAVASANPPGALSYTVNP